MSEVYQVTHLVPLSTVTISLSRFESTAIGKGVDVSNGSENLPSKDLALSVRILSDGLSVDMMVKRERHNVHSCGVTSSHAGPTVM
jgi:hypothetical protein